MSWRALRRLPAPNGQMVEPGDMVPGFDKVRDPDSWARWGWVEWVDEPEQPEPSKGGRRKR